MPTMRPTIAWAIKLNQDGRRNDLWKNTNGASPSLPLNAAVEVNTIYTRISRDTMMSTTPQKTSKHKGRSTKTIRWSIVKAGEPNFELTLHHVTNRVLRTFPMWPKHREMTIEHMILEEKLTNLSS